MEAVDKMKDVDISKGIPLLIVGCVINNALTLYSSGVEPALTDIINQSFITFFGSSLLANMVYTQIEFTLMSVLCFFVGILLFTQLKNVPGLYALTSIFPLIGKALMLLSMKNSPQPLHNIILWIMASEFFSELLLKQILNKKKLQIDNTRLAELLLEIFGIGVIRRQRLPDYYVYLLMAVVTCAPKFGFLGAYFRRSSSKESPVPSNKRSKRKAAVKVQVKG